ncbi:MarR family winged helix-turn-helix transcriptional regulator [Chromobacterium subtsugae]|uniref:MarR family winged helix-turn-helix transcriptional regulator n=1 Tax=Chromobacterium subtsugae TaxID=251747 RepID=UPI0007F8DB3F|nr:MarR family transcriptional regulator [Chromobacterium subtsugae]OBU88050.1 MarR family transcriptional regulator [Chromobacterium subtsugae]
MNAADSTAHHAPHLQLMRETASQDTDRDAAAAGLLLLWLGDDALQLVNASLSRHGLSENKLQVLLLFRLHEQGLFGEAPPTPSSIADYCGITRASATGLLDWLEKRDWVARAPHPSDRRSLQLRLTEAARTLLAEALPGFWRACARVTDALSAEEKSQLLRLLSKMQQAGLS